MAASDDILNPLDRLVLDANADGRIALADLLPWLSAAFFLPGDGLIYALTIYVAPLASLLGLGSAAYGGVLSGFVSASVWLAAYMSISIGYHYVRDVDRRLTRELARRVNGAIVRLRIVRALLRQRWQAWRAAGLPANRAQFVETVDLSTTQLRMLRLHAELAAGYSLAAGDVARALGARLSAAQDQLDELKRLGLLNRCVGGTDGESAYTLSAAGRALLVFRQLKRGEG